jgi:hypothetical protein
MINSGITKAQADAKTTTIIKVKITAPSYPLTGTYLTV